MASNPETRRSTPLLISLVVLVLIAAAVIGIRFLTRERVEVRVAHASYQDLLSTVSTNGKVEPIDEFQAHSPAPGVVKQIYVSVGDRVQAGQLLVKMDDAEPLARLASATSALRAAELAVEDMKRGGSQDERNGFAADQARAQSQERQAAADLAALQQLQQKGAASASEVDSARQRVQTAEASLHTIQQHSTQRYGDADRARAQAQLDDARAAVSAARIALNGVDIRAPQSGTVYSVPVSEYDYVPAGEDLLDVADLSHVQVRAYFDEPEIGKLAPGQPVKIVWDAKPGTVWHGRIVTAPTTVITYGTRNVGECLIAVDNASGLPPNSNVTVTVTVSQHLHVLSLPREALHTDGVKNFVFRVVDRKLVRTPVQVPAANLTRFEVGGISASDTIATAATTNRDLADGLEVTPVE
jgi:HlyD family secretion protein